MLPELEQQIEPKAEKRAVSPEKIKNDAEKPSQNISEQTVEKE